MNQLALKIKCKQWLGKLKRRRRHAKRLINQQEYRVYSQHREDGIIDYLLDLIDNDIGKFVEFGFAPLQCNCLNLALNRGFSGLFIDGSEDHCKSATDAYRTLGLHGVQVRNAFIDKESLNRLISDSGITGEIDVLSLDVDGNDYWFWEVIECIDPRIVVIEYNATFGPNSRVSVPYEANFIRYDMHSSGFYHGCSLSAIEHLGMAKGYRLVGVDETGVNAFLVKESLCPEVPTVSATDCFKDNLGRVKYKNINREQQFELIKEMPLIDVSKQNSGL